LEWWGTWPLLVPRVSLHEGQTVEKSEWGLDSGEHDQNHREDSCTAVGKEKSYCSKGFLWGGKGRCALPAGHKLKVSQTLEKGEEFLGGRAKWKSWSLGGGQRVAGKRLYAPSNLKRSEGEGRMKVQSWVERAAVPKSWGKA